MGDVQFYFGWRTALLGAAAIQCVILAIALWREGGNHVANRMLASTLAVVAGLLIPYVIGFAGLYDAFRWLTFAPFAVPLAIGPLLYGYACALADGRAPQRMRWHLAAPAIQFVYAALCFLLPLPAKWAWYTGGHRQWIEPVFDLLAPLSLAAYAVAIGRVLARHRARLADTRSDDDRFAARWLVRVRAAILIGLAVEVGFWLWSTLTGGIDFFQQTGLYLALGGLGLYLGIVGWRHAALPVPLPATVSEPEPEPEPGRSTPDWRAIAADVEQRTREAGWWQEPDLDVARLSRLLGTNTGRLSRAINLGLGMNFSTFINGLRAEAVAEALRTHPSPDLLGLALDMGFASKASFNRAFLARFGVAPSTYRTQHAATPRHVSNPDSVTPEPEMRRAGT